MDFTTKLRLTLTKMIAPNGPYKNKKQLADNLGIDPAQFNRFLSGRQGLNTDTLDKLLPAIGVKLVFPGESDRTSTSVKIVDSEQEQINGHEYKSIPLTTLSVAARPGFLDETQIESHLLVFANDPSFRFRVNLVAARIGKSQRHMIPLISPGDIVVIDKDDNQPPQSGLIYLVRDNDKTASIRRVKTFTDSSGKQIHIFYSDNFDEFPPDSFSAESRQKAQGNHSIVGKVVWLSSDLSSK